MYCEKNKKTKEERVKEFVEEHYIGIIVGYFILACTVMVVCFILYLKGIIASDLALLIAGIPIVTPILFKRFTTEYLIFLLIVIISALGLFWVGLLTNTWECVVYVFFFIICQYQFRQR